MVWCFGPETSNLGNLDPLGMLKNSPNTSKKRAQKAVFESKYLYVREIPPKKTRGVFVAYFGVQVGFVPVSGVYG